MSRQSALERFSTAETAVITGVPNETLRTWRARGLMPEHKHWNGHYDTLQVCALAIRKVMVSQGESPRDTVRVALRYAPVVLAAALRAGPALAVEHDWDDAPAVGSGAPVARYLASLDGASYQAVSQLDDVADAGASSLRLIDLHNLGERVACLAPRPLLRPSTNSGLK